MTNSYEKERAEFELYMSETFGSHVLAMNIDNSIQYQHQWVQNYWLGWVAARNQIPMLVDIERFDFTETGEFLKHPYGDYVLLHDVYQALS